MARTLKEIKKSMTDRFMANGEMQSAYGLDPNQPFEEQFSKVSFESILFDLIAIIHLILEGIFDTHKTEVNEAIRLQKSHTAINIRQRLLNFLYGYTLNDEFHEVYLIPGTDEFDTTGMTAEQIDEAKIIKYAAVTESDDEKRVICKIATETGGELSPVSQPQLEAVGAYVAAVKAAGVPYTVINYLPDMLRLNIRIFRDPLVLTSNGVHRVNGTKPVEIALQEFMKELPFNGELRLQDMANKLEIVEGVELVQIDSVFTQWIDAETGNYPAEWEAVNVRKIPVSGYFKIEDFNGITYNI